MGNWNAKFVLSITLSSHSYLILLCLLLFGTMLFKWLLIFTILSTKLLKYHSPTTLLYQRNPTYSQIQIFGCLCYQLFPFTTINKLQARSTRCLFLEYSSNHHGYRCYNLTSHKIFISRHVVFDESIFPIQSLNPNTTHTYDFILHKISLVITHKLPHLLPAQHTPQSPSHTPPWALLLSSAFSPHFRSSRRPVPSSSFYFWHSWSTNAYPRPNAFSRPSIYLQPTPTPLTSFSLPYSLSLDSLLRFL